MASGVLTYSRRTIELVGSGLANLSPLAAWVCVTAHSLVLLLFASASLKAWLGSQGLHSLPLVPVSSSQAILGAILGVGLLRGGREVSGSSLGFPTATTTGEHSAALPKTSKTQENVIS